MRGVIHVWHCRLLDDDFAAFLGEVSQGLAARFLLARAIVSSGQLPTLRTVCTFCRAGRDRTSGRGGYKPSPCHFQAPSSNRARRTCAAAAASAAGAFMTWTQPTESHSI